MDTLIASFETDQWHISPHDLAREWTAKESLSRPRWGERFDRGEEWKLPSDCGYNPKFFLKWTCVSTRHTTIGYVLDIEQIFLGLAEKWKRETGGLSVNTERYDHPSYKAIVGLGAVVIQSVLRDLEQDPDWWFDALRKLSRKNPASEAKTFEEARDAWIKWGRHNNLLK